MPPTSIAHAKGVTSAACIIMVGAEGYAPLSAFCILVHPPPTVPVLGACHIQQPNSQKSARFWTCTAKVHPFKHLFTHLFKHLILQRFSRKRNLHKLSGPPPIQSGYLKLNSIQHSQIWNPEWAQTPLYWNFLLQMPHINNIFTVWQCNHLSCTCS